MNGCLVSVLLLTIAANCKIVKAEGTSEDGSTEQTAEETPKNPETSGEEAKEDGKKPATKQPSWLIVGGYRGWEGDGGGVVTDEVELLTLKNRQDISNPDSWCHKNMKSLHTPIESASINYLPLSAFIQRNKKQAAFSPPHNLYNFDRVIMCGGADDKYNVQDRCRWWDPASDSWSGDDRFKMLRGRYSPAAVVLPRGLWMLGGRQGSTILINNEFLPYPHRKPLVNIKKWSWIHQKSSFPNDWEGLKLHENMRTLPMALAGHCALRVGKYTLVIGGGTTDYDTHGQPIEDTGPFPTNHVHLFDHLKGKWISTLYDPDKSRKITLMRTARMNHGCLLYKEGTKTRVMVVGGVSNHKDGEGERNVLQSVEILDFGAGTWVDGGALPWPMTGVSLIKVDDTPLLLGRYGTEFSNRILMYNKNKKAWEQSQANLLVGRSDAQVIEVPGGAECP